MPHLPRRRSLAGLVLTLATLGAAFAIVAGFFGAAVHGFDSMAHFRAHLAVVAAVLALVALARRHRKTAVIGLGAAALGLATTLPVLLPGRGVAAPDEAQPSYTLLQMNLRFNAEDKTEALRRIADARPDVITVQEATPEWQDALETLSEAYPYQAYCDRRGDTSESSGSGSGILSRRPFRSDGPAFCRPLDGLIVRSVDLNGQPLTIASLHLEWPWPAPHWRQIAEMAPLLPTLPQPSLLAGDFNAAPWSAAVGAVARAGGWRVLGGIGPSWMTLDGPAIPAAWFGLPIDNILLSPAVSAISLQRLAPTASDHLPVLMRFQIEPAAGPPATNVARAS